MTHFDEPYWNLAQTAAWVVYREKNFVDTLANPTAESYAAIGLYKTMWPDHRKKYSKLSTLQNALSDGRLIAKGFHEDTPDRLAAIPSEAWSELNLQPPSAFDSRHPGIMYEPWKRIRLKSADVKKLWRGTDELLGRSKFDWVKIQSIYEGVLNRNPDFSQNKLIDEIQLEFQDTFSKEPPSRSAIQTKIKTWR